MKTKNKILALVEIAVVLCSLFLVAIPALAAEQSIQEVSANTVTTASEDDYVLDVYGNANEDDTIDMRDLTYVKLIFFGKKPETELADAKYDGKINPLDFIQIKLIIVGKEKELTLVDSADRTVTVKKPINTIIPDNGGEVVRILQVQEKVVGVSKYIKDDEVFFPELSKLPMIGTTCIGHGELDYEKLLELNPDVLIAYASHHPELEEMLKPTSITLICFELFKPEIQVEEVRKLGYIFNKRDEAEEFIGYMEECIDQVKEKTENLPDEDKPRVYHHLFGKYQTSNKFTSRGIMVEEAGGINIAADIMGSGIWPDYPDIDPEWVIVQNPEIVVIFEYYASNGYDEDDPSEMKAVREEFLNRPELAEVDAIKDKRVYVIYNGCSYFEYFLGMPYLAKWFHPELFEDLDPQALHQEYLTRFQHLDYDLDKHGVFVYPPLK